MVCPAISIFFEYHQYIAWLSCQVYPCDIVSKPFRHRLFVRRDLGGSSYLWWQCCLQTPFSLVHLSKPCLLTYASLLRVPSSTCLFCCLSHLLAPLLEVLFLSFSIYASTNCPQMGVLLPLSSRVTCSAEERGVTEAERTATTDQHSP